MSCHAAGLSSTRDRSRGPTMKSNALAVLSITRSFLATAPAAAASAGTGLRGEALALSPRPSLAAVENTCVALIAGYFAIGLLAVIVGA
jgi:hypothetical protein